MTTNLIKIDKNNSEGYDDFYAGVLVALILIQNFV